MENIPNIDFVEVQFIAEKLLSLYSIVGKYGGIAVLYASGDNVYMSYVLTEESLDELVKKIKKEAEWADLEKMKKHAKEIGVKLDEIFK